MHRVDEEWSPIEQTDGYYEISRSGQVRRAHDHYPMKLYNGKFSGQVNGRRTTLSVRKLLGKATGAHPMRRYTGMASSPETLKFAHLRFKAKGSCR